MLLDSLHAPRDVARLHEIARVLVRHGLGEVLRRLGVVALLRRAGHALHLRKAEETEDLSTPERLRHALEELGPTFVKLGQVLAGRKDLLGPEWTRELSRLHEHVAPAEPEAVRAQLTEDLGAAPEEVFAEYEAEPFASGSIAQVHGAALADGTRVVLKVRRPGIESRVESDLAWVGRLAAWLEERDSDLGRYRPRALARQVSRSLRAELDLREEARNLERLRRELSHEPDLVLPRVPARYSGERLLVMDRFEGPSMGTWVDSEDFDPALGRRLARVGADASLHLVFRAGFFHADPHPGNVFLLEGGRMGLLDAGMVGYLSERRRLEVGELLSAAADGRVDGVVEVLSTWSAGPEVDLEALEADARAFVDRYRDLPQGELDLAEVLRDVQEVLRANDLVLPDDVAGLLKVFVTLDGLGRSLDPNFVMAERLRPYLRDALEELRSPRAMMARVLSATRTSVASLPRDVARLRRLLREGRVPIEVGLRDMDRLYTAWARSANRLTLGLVTSALIVGTSIALDAGVGPQAMGLNLFALLGFVSSVLMGIVLVWNLRR